MAPKTRRLGSAHHQFVVAGSLALVAISTAVGWNFWPDREVEPTAKVSSKTPQHFEPRYDIDSSGLGVIGSYLEPLPRAVTLPHLREAWMDLAPRSVQRIDREIASKKMLPDSEMFSMLYTKSIIQNFGGDAKGASKTLDQLRMFVTGQPKLESEYLYSVIFLQGVTALRQGENDNCILCRGESSCILPISPAAQHKNQAGSRQAIVHFTEYLHQFPDDLGAQWLLNVAHMTLGEYPDRVDPRYRISIDKYEKSELDIGKFRDIGHLIGVNRLNQSGGAIMDDFDNDGLLDLVITATDPTEQMLLLRNNGQGSFDDCTPTSGLVGQYGGLNCVQTDYNNDGFLDVLVIRGAWVAYPVRPSLLRNNGDDTFTDVTEEAGMLEPVNSIAAQWADYDNDGCLDLFVCCERQPNRLYHNLGNGQFEEVASSAGVTPPVALNCKGVAWIDYDNDGFPDLFQDYLLGDVSSRLLHNNRDGTFKDVTRVQGIRGPFEAFACWAWDYDNDGWLDIFATCYDHPLEEVVKGLMGKPHNAKSNKLYRNRGGTGFEDVTKDAGLDMVFSTMGSNFGDLDNDGFLDMYLGTGEPRLEWLVPNRMFKNVGGKRFAEISTSSGTGHLQKGHGVSIGDWDRDGNNDLFIEMGGATNGDKYHNIMFQNPGHDNRWLTVKLTGAQTNQAAIGARIKVVTKGRESQTFYRHVSSGSSFGANPLEQTMGLAKAEKIETLEIQWPTSGTTQVFHDLDVNQSIAIREFDDTYHKMAWTQVPLPAGASPNGH